MSTTDPAPVTADTADVLAGTPVQTACKICRGNGLNLTFTDSTTYDRHIVTVHPDSVI